MAKDCESIGRHGVVVRGCCWSAVDLHVTEEGIPGLRAEGANGDGVCCGDEAVWWGVRVRGEESKGVVEYLGVEKELKTSVVRLK